MWRNRQTCFIIGLLNKLFQELISDFTPSLAFIVLVWTVRKTATKISDDMCTSLGSKCCNMISLVHVVQERQGGKIGWYACPVYLPAFVHPKNGLYSLANSLEITRRRGGTKATRNRLLIVVPLKCDKPRPAKKCGELPGHRNRQET